MWQKGRLNDSLTDALRHRAKAKENLQHEYGSTEQVKSNEWVVETEDDVTLPDIPARSRQWEKNRGRNCYSRRNNSSRAPEVFFHDRWNVQFQALKCK